MTFAKIGSWTPRTCRRSESRANHRYIRSGFNLDVSGQYSSCTSHFALHGLLWIRAVVNRVPNASQEYVFSNHELIKKFTSRFHLSAGSFFTYRVCRRASGHDLPPRLRLLRPLRQVLNLKSHRITYNLIFETNMLFWHIPSFLSRSNHVFTLAVVN